MTNNVTKIIGHAEHHCKSHGARLTAKRKLVLSSLLTAKKALSAYELIDHYAEANKETLPAMSMYRILDFLQEEGLVHKLNLANKFVACAHISCNHEHATPQFLICKKCQRVEEISISKKIIHELEKNVTDAGFQLTSPQLEMNCICNACESDVA